MTLQLVALRGPLVGRTFTLGPDGLWMGRTLEAPIPLGSHLASRRHAEVRLEGSVPVMRDLGSINGTRVNGERVQVRPLQIGDVIEIGDEAFRLVTGEVPRPAATYGNVVGLRGPLAGREVPVGDAPVTFGRALDCSLVIQSQRASRKHAEIRLEPAGPTLIDLRSGNGTLVNGERVPTRLLEHGDVIEIGDEAFRFDAAATSIRARAASPLASSMPSLAPEVPPAVPPAAPRAPSAAAPPPGAAPSAAAPPWAAPATNAPPWSAPETNAPWAAPATNAPWSAPATSAPWSGGPTTAEPPWASQPTSVPGWAAPATHAGPAITGPHTPFPGAPSAPSAPPAPAWNAPPPVGPPPPPPTAPQAQAAPQAQPAAPPWTPPAAAPASAASPPPAPAPAGPPPTKPKRSLRGTMPMPASSPLANAPSAPAPPAPPPLSRGPVQHTAPMPQSPAPGAAPQNAGAPAVGIRCPQCRRVVDARYRDCPWDGASLANGEIVR